MTEASDQLITDPKGISVERVRREARKEKESVPAQVSRGVEEGMGRFSKEVEAQYKDEVSKVVGNILQLTGSLRGLPESSKGVEKLIGKFDASVLVWQDIQRRQLHEIVAQTPEELRVPTKERWAQERLREKGKEQLTMEEIEKEAEKISDEELAGYAKNWFETRLRHLESFDLAFEEQATLMSPLVLAVTQYELDPQMKELGEEFRSKFEARRKRQRLVRVWGMQPPRGITAEGGGINNATLKELFTYQTEDGDKPIEEEFRNFEKMGVELKKLKDEIKPLEKGTKKSKLENRKDDLQTAIEDFQNHGGYVSEGGEIVPVDQIIETPSKGEGGYLYLDDYLSAEQGKKPSEDEKEIDRLKKFKETLWARRFSGGLWSITMRAGKFNVALNGLGDVFVQRALNISENLPAKGLQRNTRGIWDPKDGTPFDLGYSDYFTVILAGARVQRRGGEGDPHYGDLRKDWLENTAGIEEADYETSPGKNSQKPKQDIERLEDVKSLVHAKLGEEDFWDDLENKYGAGEKFSTHLKKLEDADETRSRFWDADSFFHNPGRGKFLKLAEVFEHIPEVMVDLEDLKGDKIGIRATKREQKWQEIIERTLVWMKKDKQAKEIVETLNIYPAAEMFGWIEEASAAEMITNQQSDYLFKKYLNIPLIPGSPKGKARLRSTLSVVTSPLRYPQARQFIAVGTFMEFLKRGFAYIFSDEVGRR